MHVHTLSDKKISGRSSDTCLLLGSFGSGYLQSVNQHHYAHEEREWESGWNHAKPRRYGSQDNNVCVCVRACVRVGGGQRPVCVLRQYNCKRAWPVQPYSVAPTHVTVKHHATAANTKCTLKTHTHSIEFVDSSIKTEHSKISNGGKEKT